MTFDPFMYLSLPLPTDTKRHTEIVFVPYDPYIFPQHMVLILDHDAAIVDLKAATANLAKVDDPSTVSDRSTAIKGMPNCLSFSFL